LNSIKQKIPYFAVSTNPENANDSSQNYPIYFNEQGYEALNLHINSNKYSTVFIIVDTNTNEFCLPTFLPYIEKLTIEIIEFEAGEENKNIDTCVQFGMFSQSLALKSLIKLGGGVVTDLGGFVASTFKRGVDFINIPYNTTMVDASVGGKNELI
jgi:3-dehydroquinate synthase